VLALVPWAWTTLTAWVGPLLATDPPTGPYLAGMIAGFTIGTFGHIIKSTLLISLGIVTIVVTTILFIGATDPHLGPQ
jgi:hypothetical protein